MNREEAIKNIKEHCYFANLIPQAKEALDMAIKALDQEPCRYWQNGKCNGNTEVCEDAISRQVVLDLAKKGVLISNGSYKSVCKAINEIPSVNPQLCEDAISRQYLIDIATEDGAYDYVSAQEIANAPSVNPQPKTGHWIPVSEGLPERAEGGASNWHTDTVMVCMYGNAQYDGYDDFGYEILTGIFEELEDEETKTKDLCFVPDRFTLFIPDEWDFFVLDKNYETHLPKNECMYLVDDYSDKSEFHDKYFKVLAWMPLPKSYEPQERSEKQ